MGKSVISTIAQVKGPHLIVESMKDETVVFDRRTNKAHMLDARATAIWNAAANGCSLDDVVALVDGETTAQKQAAAQLGISDLERAGLLITDMPAMPRRGLLKTLGAAAMVPMVVSILAPTPAAAASNVADGATCIVGTDTCATAGRTCIAGADGTRCCVTGSTNTLLDNASTTCSGSKSASCCSGKCNNGTNKCTGS